MNGRIFYFIHAMAVYKLESNVIKPLIMAPGSCILTARRMSTPASAYVHINSTFWSAEAAGRIVHASCSRAERIIIKRHFSCLWFVVDEKAHDQSPPWGQRRLIRACFILGVLARMLRV